MNVNYMVPDYIDNTNYKEWISESEKLLKTIFNFFDISSSDELNYYDTQEVINFQDKLNAYSVSYFETKQQKIRNILDMCKTTIRSQICQDSNKQFWKYVKDTVISVIENWKDKDILEDYDVICDERSNTPELIDKHKCRVQVILHPKGTHNRWWIEEHTQSYYRL